MNKCDRSLTSKVADQKFLSTHTCMCTHVHTLNMRPKQTNTYKVTNMDPIILQVHKFGIHKRASAKQSEPIE